MDSSKNKSSQNNTQQPQQIIIPVNNAEPRKIICDVCGHANPEYTSQCKKCSNYLQRS